MLLKRNATVLYRSRKSFRTCQFSTGAAIMKACLCCILKIPRRIPFQRSRDKLKSTSVSSLTKFLCAVRAPRGLGLVRNHPLRCVSVYRAQISSFGVFRCRSCAWASGRRPAADRPQWPELNPCPWAEQCNA